MNKYISIILFLILIPLASYGLDTLLFGAGGEPKGDTTNFDTVLSNLFSARDRVDLTIESNFNGEHKTTESTLKKANIPNKPFTIDNFKKTIDEYAKKISKMKKGEQLLILIDTHGEPASIDSSTHMIDMSNSTGGATYSSMDNLKILTQLAVKNGVKLGIVDFSCFSGNSISLANENTCVISGTGSKHFGYDDFTQNFYDNMKKGQSLEDVFLKSRIASRSPAFPMISTPEGIKVHDEIYQLLTPYMYYAKPGANKILPYLENINSQGEIGICKRDEEFRKLLDLISPLVKIEGKLKGQYSGEEDLVASLKEYKKYQDEYLKLLNDNNFSLLNTVEKYNIDPKNPNRSETITWKNALNANDEIVKFFEDNYLKEKDSKLKKEKADALNKAKYALNLKRNILLQHPELEKAMDLGKNLSLQAEKIKTMAEKVSLISNKLYEYNYKETKLKNGKQTNACSDFVF